jgi:benzoyl-CoA reductase/2-hydroxyglutaryl-CoA dehydratase subunit BcrC/BadD/HgdB
MNIGTRYFWGKVDTSLPPMEGIARHYLFNRPQEAMIYLSNRFDHIFKMAEECNVDGVAAQVVGYCAPLENDKPWLKKEMEKRDIPQRCLSFSPVKKAYEPGLPI